MSERSANAANSSDPVNGISDVYSDMDMRLRLAAKPNEAACNGETCVMNHAFDDLVQALGLRLAESAYVVYPDLKKKIPNFTFSVADKKVIGSASTASGKVVLFRAIQHLDLGEEATAFIVAREMGHVIANHHKSNAKTKLFFTLLAGVMFPAINLLSASSAAAQATTATTLMTSAASTATSFVGSEMALSRIKPTQLSEADDVALKLLEQQGWSKAEVAQALEFIVENEQSAAWEKDLYLSMHYVRKLADESQESTLLESAQVLEPLPEAYMAEAIAAPEIEPVSEAQIVVVQDPDVIVERVNLLIPLAPAAAESKPVAIKTTELKPTEPRKSILITNETIAQSHHQVDKVVEKPALAKVRKPQKDARKMTASKADKKAKKPLKAKKINLASKVKPSHKPPLKKPKN